MESLLTVARQVAILFVLMGFGAAMRRAGFFKENAIDGIVNILILVVTPCLIVDVFQRPFAPSMLKGLGCAFAISVLVHIALIALARLVVRHRDEDVRSPLRLAVVFSNAGFMGVPLEQAVLGDEGVFYGVVYVAVYNLFFWSWGYVTMQKTSASSPGRQALSKKMWINPGTVGLALGVPIFFLSAKLPEVLAVPVHHMANLNTPLAMIVIGYTLAGASFGRVLRTGAVYVSSFARLVVSPLLLVAVLCAFRQSMDRTMMLALVIAASAPVGAMVAMFATKFGRNVDMAVSVVSGTTLLSILTMPPVIALAMAVL